MIGKSVVWSVLASTLVIALADYRLPGGETTVFDASREAFTQPADNLDPREFARFFSGDTLFNTNWVSASSVVDGRDGLGPLFNTRSCSSCHFKDGRGEPPSLGKISDGFLVRLSLPGKDLEGGPKPHPIYGNQISVRALPKAKPEARVSIEYEHVNGSYPDGTSYSLLKPIIKIDNWGYGEPGNLLKSARVASAVYGLGLLDAIADESILALADPEDRDNDGISGRANRVWSPSKQTHSIGKYGWKANKATLLDQAAGAFQGDIGITSPLFPEENHSLQQLDSVLYPSGGNPEIENRDLEDVVFYLKTLAPPSSRFTNQESYQSGKELFEMAKCSSCHTPRFQTREDYSIQALAGQLIYPYTDLLLHDMGDGLADNRPDFEANGREWRTPPLWGIGLIPTVNRHSRLLHDGRARNIEEAILWHGGEAESSKQAFMKLAREQRRELLKFVRSL